MQNGVPHWVHSLDYFFFHIRNFYYLNWWNLLQDVFILFFQGIVGKQKRSNSRVTKTVRRTVSAVPVLPGRIYKAVTGS